MNKLVKFWASCSLKRRPYIHPKDRIAIKTHGISTTFLKNHEAFFRHPTFVDNSDRSLHVGLLPVPYQGNLARADIFIVMLNPGLGLSDYQVDEDKGHGDQIRKILKQDFVGVEFPFLSLNPKYAWTGGFQWWEGKLRKTIRKVADEFCNGSYENALKFLSKRLACIELLPYHSRAFGSAKLYKLESVKVAREFVLSLLPSARKGEITIIVSRAIKKIGIKNHRLVNHDPKLARSAPLGPKTTAGKAIVRQLRRR